MLYSPASSTADLGIFFGLKDHMKFIGGTPGNGIRPSLGSPIVITANFAHTRQHFIILRKTSTTARMQHFDRST